MPERIDKYQQQIIENLKYLRESYKIKQEKFGEIVGLNRQQVTRLETDRMKNIGGIEVIRKAAEYFEIDINDIIYKDLSNEDFEDLKADTSEKYIKSQNLRVLTVTVDKNQKEYIVLVSEKAAAGYTNENTQEEYIKTLPTFNLPGLTSERTYRAFEVVGDSMLPITPGSLVIGEFIEDFNDLRDGDICVIVTKNGQGIVLKKTYKHLDKNQILLKSSNLNYRPYAIEATQIKEIWKMVRIITQQIVVEDANNVQEIKEVLSNMQEEIRQLQTQAK